jgi:hypothetical protein
MANRRRKDKAPVVVEVPKGCPTCGSIARTHTKTRTAPKAGMVDPDTGIHHRHGVVFRYWKCDKCPQIYVTRSPMPEQVEPEGLFETDGDDTTDDDISPSRQERQEQPPNS